MGLQKVIIYDSQGNLISGNDQFDMSEVAILRARNESRLIRIDNNTARFTNVGYFRGEVIDVILHGPAFTRWRIWQPCSWSRIPNLELEPISNSRAYTDNFRVEAVFSGSSERLDAMIMLSTYETAGQRPNTFLFPEHSVFRLLHRSRRNQVNFSYNQNTNMLSWASPTHTTEQVDAILNNNVVITHAIGHSISSGIWNSVKLFVESNTIYSSEKLQGRVIVRHLDENDRPIAVEQVIKGELHHPYVTNPIQDEDFQLISTPSNASGYFSLDDTIVTYHYKSLLPTVEDPPAPVDPLDPETEVNPENRPELPEDQGLISIDFVSRFDFGEQKISTQDRRYYAKSQRLLDDNSLVIEDKKRPNYIQISDRRLKENRGGWQLSVTQQAPFFNEEGSELRGAQLSFRNGELIPVKNNSTPPFFVRDESTLIPGVRRTLIMADQDEGQGTWVYRFGNQDNFKESIFLEVPGSANPTQGTYSTTLIWQFQAVPIN